MRFLMAGFRDCKRDGRSLTSPGATDTTSQICRLAILPSVAGLPLSIASRIRDDVPPGAGESRKDYNDREMK
jgi:hypothetical protein